jgi:hypothetical protein
VGRAELGARIESPAPPAQPFPVEKLCAGQIGHGPAAAEPLDGGAVLLVRVVTVADHRPRPCLDPQRPLGASRPRPRCEALVRGDGVIELTGTGGRVDKLGEDPRRADVVVLARAPGGGERVPQRFRRGPRTLPHERWRRFSGLDG